MNQFTEEELKNLLNLINIAPIKGNDAMIVALLQQKIVGLIKPVINPVKKPEKA